MFKLKQKMVNTRHSVNASHEDDDVKNVNENCIKIAGRKIDKEEVCKYFKSLFIFVCVKY